MIESNDYLWSGVISLNTGPVEPPEIMKASFTKEFFEPKPSKLRGRPLKNWSFIFSPADFDDDISLEQFQAKHLSPKEMLNFGQMATVI